jgi:hypothetical protein
MIEKILEKLEEAFPINPYPNEFSNGRDLGIKKAIDIVQEVAKEYGKDTNVRSNADHIRSMSDEELAEFLVDHHNYPCKYCVHCWKDSENDVGCRGALMRWLKSEAKE